MREIASVSYTHLDVYKRQVLDMTVEEALEFFKNIPGVARKLQTLFDVGLGYIRLGPVSYTHLSRAGMRNQIP